MIIVLGTSSPGGISQVIKGYARDGIFEKWDIRWVKTHVAGSMLRRLLAALCGIFSVIFLLSCRDVRLVHAHAAMRGSFWRKSVLVAVARLFRVPVIMHLHGSEMRGFYASSNWIARWWIRSTLECADQVVVLSAGWAEYVRIITHRARISVVANYSPALPLVAGHSSSIRKEGCFIFLFLGALIDRKGIYELLPAYAKLAEEIPGTELWLGGSGEIERVQAVIQQYELSSVRLLGWVDEARRTNLLAEVDAFVLPSKNENLPLSIIEAMSAALPIVSTHEMLIDGEDAILVTPGNVDQLYKALKEIRIDKVNACRMSRNAFKRYEAEFSMETGLSKINELYARVGKKISPRSRI